MIAKLGKLLDPQAKLGSEEHGKLAHDQDIHIDVRAAANTASEFRLVPCPADFFLLLLLLLLSP